LQWSGCNRQAGLLPTPGSLLTRGLGRKLQLRSAFESIDKCYQILSGPLEFRPHIHKRERIQNIEKFCVQGPQGIKPYFISPAGNLGNRGSFIPTNEAFQLRYDLFLCNYQSSSGEQIRVVVHLTDCTPPRAADLTLRLDLQITAPPFANTDERVP